MHRRDVERLEARRRDRRRYPRGDRARRPRDGVRQHLERRLFPVGIGAPRERDELRGARLELRVRGGARRGEHDAAGARAVAGLRRLPGRLDATERALLVLEDVSRGLVQRPTGILLEQHRKRIAMRSRGQPDPVLLRVDQPAPANELLEHRIDVDLLRRALEHAREARDLRLAAEERDQAEYRAAGGVLVARAQQDPVGDAPHLAAPGGARARRGAVVVPPEIAAHDAVGHGLDHAERHVGGEPCPAAARDGIERVVRAAAGEALRGVAAERLDLDLGSARQRREHRRQPAGRVEPRDDPERRPAGLRRDGARLERGGVDVLRVVEEEEAGALPFAARPEERGDEPGGDRERHAVTPDERLERVRGVQKHRRELARDRPSERAPERTERLEARARRRHDERALPGRGARRELGEIARAASAGIGPQHEQRPGRDRRGRRWHADQRRDAHARQLLHCLPTPRMLPVEPHAAHATLAVATDARPCGE